MQPHRPTVFLFERGINGWASIFGDWKNWPNQAIVSIHQTGADNGLDWRAQTLTYFTGPVFAGLTRHKRAKNLSKLIRAYSVKNWNIVIVAHSEGTATVLQALKDAGWPKVQALHLLCGACDANFNRNGLNGAILQGKIDSVHVYVADKDKAMRLEDTILGHWFFGIRTKDLPLGLSGPRSMTLVSQKATTVHHWKNYGHSDCWLQDNFKGTMTELIHNSDFPNSFAIQVTCQTH